MSQSIVFFTRKPEHPELLVEQHNYYVRRGTIFRWSERSLVYTVVFVRENIPILVRTEIHSGTPDEVLKTVTPNRGEVLLNAIEL